MSKTKAVLGSLFVMLVMAAAAPVALHQQASAQACYFLKKYTAPDGGTVCANDGNQCMACIQKQ